MTRLVALAVIVSAALAASAEAQPVRSTGATVYEVPYGWVAAPHASLGVVASPWGEVRMMVWPPSPPGAADEAWLRSLAEVRIGELGGRATGPGVLVELADGRLALRQGYIAQAVPRTVWVTGAEAAEGRRGVGVEALAPLGPDAYADALEAWARTVVPDPDGAGQSSGAAPPVPLDGTYAHVASRSRLEWGAVPPLASGTDAELWIQTRVDAYVFDGDAGRVQWGLGGDPADAPPHRVGRATVSEGHVEVAFDDGSATRLEATIPAADAASVWLGGRRYDRLRPVEALSEIDGDWRHDAVIAVDARTAEGGIALESVRTVDMRFDASAGIVRVATSGVVRELRPDGSGSTGSPSRADERAVTLASPGVLRIGSGGGEGRPTSAFRVGEWLVLGQSAFRRPETASTD